MNWFCVCNPTKRFISRQLLNRRGSQMLPNRQNWISLTNRDSTSRRYPMPMSVCCWMCCVVTTICLFATTNWKRRGVSSPQPCIASKRRKFSPFPIRSCRVVRSKPIVCPRVWVWFIKVRTSGPITVRFRNPHPNHRHRSRLRNRYRPVHFRLRPRYPKPARLFNPPASNQRAAMCVASYRRHGL